MAKKKEVEKVGEPVVVSHVEAKKQIGLVTLDFNRQDLNDLRDKINEIIKELNK